MKLQKLIAIVTQINGFNKPTIIEIPYFSFLHEHKLCLPATSDQPIRRKKKPEKNEYCTFLPGKVHRRSKVKQRIKNQTQRVYPDNINL